MIKYVKLREATELPCVHCGKKDTPYFLVEITENNKIKTHYMCKECFKAFQENKSVELKEYFESDLSQILKSASA